MERHIKKVFCLLIMIFLTYGCSSGKVDEEEAKYEESIKGFTLRQFAEKTSFVLTGESAETSGESGTSVKNPSLSLKTPHDTIEIKTGKDGKGNFVFLAETRRINKVEFTGEIKILYREISTGKITMEGTCKKLTYIEKDKMLIMEGSPVLKSDKNIFSGDTIYYNLGENTLEIEGNVNVQIPAD